MIARPRRQPFLHLGMFVRSVVIQNHVDVQRRIDALVDAIQESQKLLMTMTRLALGDDRSLEHIESSEEGGGSMALIIVRLPFRQARAQGKNGLGAIQRLNLTFLVHAE